MAKVILFLVLATISITVLAKPASNQNDPVLPEIVEEEPEVRNCAIMSCNTHCIFRGFPDGGFCQGSVCVCRNPRNFNEEEVVQKEIPILPELVKVELEARNCAIMSCNTHCIFRGFPDGGFCQGSVCVCRNPRNFNGEEVIQQEIPILPEPVKVELEARNCAIMSCNTHCIFRGFPDGGFCQGSVCVCRNPRNFNGEEVIQQEIPILPEPVKVELEARNCAIMSCNTHCIFRGFPDGGFCQGSVCVCRNPRNFNGEEVIQQEIPILPEPVKVELEARNCAIMSCNTHCIFRGFPDGGFCQGSVCVCRNPRNFNGEEVIQQEIPILPEPVKVELEARNCAIMSCNTHCIFRGFPDGGFCQGSVCVCRNPRNFNGEEVIQQEIPILPEPVKVELEARNCAIMSCNTHCIFRGFPDGGFCQGSVCVCRNPRNFNGEEVIQQEIPILPEPVKVELEARNCAIMSCNTHCIFRGFPDGGFCQGSVCVCRNPRNFNGEEVIQQEIPILPEPVKVELEARNCAIMSCNTHCIFRGFPDGGFCQGSVCVCRNPRNFNGEEVIQQEIPILPEPVKVELEARNCAIMSCNTHCIFRGFPDGGFCQGSVCVCRNPRNFNGEEVIQQEIPILPEPVKVELEARNCAIMSCNTHCIFRGFPDSGFCQGSVCVCRNPRNFNGEEVIQQEIPILPEPVKVELEARNCAIMSCNTHCIFRGFPDGGFCQGSVCVCRNPRNFNGEEVIQQEISILPEPVKVELEARNCATMSCNTHCIFRGFPDGGFCQSGVCVCRNPRFLEGQEVYQEVLVIIAEPVEEEVQSRNCATMSCNTHCIFRGFPNGGFCQSGACVCRR